ncbi:ABC-2 transporter permease [candidate division KSB1 bacterium]
MLLKLIFADIYSYKKELSLIIFLFPLVSASIIFQYYHWNVYVMQGNIFIAYLCAFPCFMRIKYKTEIHECSLPVRRIYIIYKTYIMSALLAVFGLFIWYSYAYVADILFTDSVSKFSYMFYLKTFFMTALYLSINLGIFLPATFFFKTIGLVITFLLAMTAAVLPIPLLYAPYKSSYNPYFLPEDMVQCVMLTIMMFMFCWLSVFLSLKIYRKKDI